MNKYEGYDYDLKGITKCFNDEDCQYAYMKIWVDGEFQPRYAIKVATDFNDFTEMIYLVGEDNKLTPITEKYKLTDIMDARFKIIEYSEDLRELLKEGKYVQLRNGGREQVIKLENMLFLTYDRINFSELTNITTYSEELNVLRMGEHEYDIMKIYDINGVDWERE